MLGQWTIADDAATGQRNLAIVQARQQRPQEANRRAHLAHQLVGRNAERCPARTSTTPSVLSPRDLHAQPAQDVAHELDVAEIRHTTDGTRFAREQGRGDNWQGGVFGAADLYGSAKRIFLH